MIDSMTKEERRNPDIIDINRRRRIAAGSGTEPHEIKQFLGQFDQVRDADAADGQDEHLGAHQDDDRHGQGGRVPARRADAAKTKVDTGHRKSPKERAEERKKKRRRQEVASGRADGVDRPQLFDH